MRTRFEEPEQSPEPEELVGRVFLHDPYWKIHRKNDSAREFCSLIAPGENYYHRISVGELYLESMEERLCFPCGQRRGLLGGEPKALKPPRVDLELGSAQNDSEELPLAD